MGPILVDVQFIRNTIVCYAHIMPNIPSLADPGFELHVGMSSGYANHCTIVSLGAM